MFETDPVVVARIVEPGRAEVPRRRIVIHEQRDLSLCLACAAPNWPWRSERTRSRRRNHAAVV